MIYQFIAAVVLSMGLLVPVPEISQTIEAVDWLVFVKHRQRYKHYPHPLEKLPDIRQEIADGIDESAVKYDVPARLLVAITWKESRFRPDIISGKTRGKRGEIGLGQQHGVAARGCDLSDIPGQLDCTGRGLRMAMDLCDGSVWQGLMMYATGRCKVSDESSATCVICRRFILWHRLEDVVDGRQ